MAIVTKRIMNLQNAASVANDDYIAIDGATKGTRKYATNGKGLSKNDYTDADKAALAGAVSDLAQYQGIFTGNVDTSIQNWLDAHPEATTTVTDGAITEAKLADALKNKLFNWYRIDAAQNFGVVSDIELPVKDSYCDGICYDSVRNKLYIIAYASGTTSYIVKLNLETYTIEQTEYYSFGRPNALTYDPNADRIYVYVISPTESVVSVNPETLAVISELSISKPIAYDSAKGQFITYCVQSESVTVQELDTDFSVVQTYEVTLDTNGSSLQGIACHEQIMYLPTWESLYEIDYTNNRVNEIKLKGYGIGLAEPEQIVFVDSDMYMLCNLAGHDGYTHILKYGVSSTNNLTTLHTYARKVIRISDVITDYPTLFEFVSDVSAGTYVLYGYETIFSDIPQLFSGSAYTANIILEKPINDLGYAQIEVTLIRANPSIDMWKKFRGVIQSNTATEITWAEYGLSQPVGSITFNTTYATPADICCEQINHICAVSFSFKANQALSAGTVIATNLPLPTTANIVVEGSNNNTGAIVYFTIGIDGAFKLAYGNQIASGNSIRISFTYWAKNPTNA